MDKCEVSGKLGPAPRSLRNCSGEMRLRVLQRLKPVCKGCRKQARAHQEQWKTFGGFTPMKSATSRPATPAAG